jgi:phosphoribosylanthranilate isomerase
MVKAKDSNIERLNAGGTEKRKSIKSTKAKGLAFPKTISGSPAPKPKSTKTKSKKKALILVDSSVEGSKGEEEDEDEDVKIE